MIPFNEVIKEIEELDSSLFHDEIVFGRVVNTKDPPEQVFFIFKFISKTEPVPKDFQYDYEECSIICKTITINDLKSMIKTRGNILTVSVEQRNIEGTGFEKQRIQGNRSWGLFQAEFPTLYYFGNMQNNSLDQDINSVMTGKNSPPFPHLANALAHIFRLKVPRDFQQRQVVIVVPDLRARIKEVVIDQKKISVKIENRGYGKNEIILQIYASGDDISESELEVEIQNDIGEITFEHDYDHIMIVLFTKSGIQIEQKDITKYNQHDPSVIIKITEPTLSNIMGSGENQHVEFKSKLKSPEQIAKTIVGFANSEGGKILIGVDDGGKMQEIEKIETVIPIVTEWIAKFCEPIIRPEMYLSDDKRIVIIDVPSGTEKPYFLKTGGCYIRHGASNILATRTEDEMMRKNKENLVTTEI